MSAEAPQLVLYDLRGSKEPWNLNVAKTRQLLHAKGVPFQVEWVEYSNMPQIFGSKGFKGDVSQKPPMPTYTVPTLQIGEDEYVMDSEKIAERIEELFPDHGLVVDRSADSYKQVDTLITNGLLKDDQLRFVTVYDVYTVFLKGLPESRSYFYNNRLERFGDIFESTPRKSDSYWEAAAPNIAKLGRLLLAKPGPFVNGQTPSYGDVRICALLSHFFRVSEDSFQRFLAMDEEGGIAKLWKATTAWRPEFA